MLFVDLCDSSSDNFSLMVSLFVEGVVVMVFNVVREVRRRFIETVNRSAAFAAAITFAVFVMVDEVLLVFCGVDMRLKL